MPARAPERLSRSGVAAVEFALCLPLMLLILTGMWEVGRIVEIQQVAFNAAREGARAASMGSEYLDPGMGGINPGIGSPKVYTPNVANDVLQYLQAAEPQAFAQGHATSWAVATGLPPNTVGYTCTDTTVTPHRELFTITYANLTTTSSNDPVNANKLDNYQIGIQVPYAGIAISPLPRITTGSRLYATVNWLCMKDSPFQVSPVLPAQ